MGQGDAVVAIDLHGQTRAVGAGAAGTAVDIADAHKGHGIVHHGAAQGAAPGNHTGAEGLGRGGVAAGEDLGAGAHGVGAVIILVGNGGAEVGGDIAGHIGKGDEKPAAGGVDVLELGNLAGLDLAGGGGDTGIGIHGGTAAELHAVVLRQKRQIAGQLLTGGLLRQLLRFHLVQRQKLQLGDGGIFAACGQVIFIQTLGAGEAGGKARLQTLLLQGQHGLPVVLLREGGGGYGVCIGDGHCGDENGQRQANAADPSGHMKNSLLPCGMMVFIGALKVVYHKSIKKAT